MAKPTSLLKLLGCSWISMAFLTEWSTNSVIFATAALHHHWLIWLGGHMCCIFITPHLIGMAHLPNIHFITYTQYTAHARAPRGKDITLTPHDRDKDNLRHVRNHLNTNASYRLRFHLPHQPLMKTKAVSKTLDIHSTQMLMITPTDFNTVMLHAVKVKLSLCSIS
jgi:hypothetical protein